MTLSPAESRRQAWIRRLSLLVIALAARGLFLYAIRHNPFFDSPIIDAQTYDEQAQAIARGEWTGGEVFWQPPLYPYVLGLLYRVAGHSLGWARLLQALLTSMIAVLASELAVRRFGSRVAWLTGLLLTFYGPLFFYTGELLVPPLSLSLDLAMLLALTPPGDRAVTPRRLAMAGLFLGLSAVARPTILLMLPVLVLWLLRPARDASSVGSADLPSPARLRSAAILLPARLRAAAILLTATALPIAPASLHNLWIGHEPVLISSNGGINFYLGNNPDYDGAVGIRPGLPWNTLIQEPELHGIRSAKGASDYWSARAWDFILGQPLQALELELKKTWLLLQAYEIPRNVDYNFFVAHYAPWLRGLVQFGALLPLAMLGMWRTRHEPDQGLWRAFLLCTSASIIAFFVVGRYRMSLVPVLAVYGAVGLEALWTQACAAAWRSLGPAMTATAGIALLIQADPFHVARIDEAEGFNLVGKASSNAGRRSQSIQAFKQALAVNPALTDAQFNLARELQLEHRCDEAIPHYEIVRAAYPRDRETLNNLAVCYLQNGRIDAGIALLEQMRSFYPDVVAIYYNLGEAYLKAGRTADAKATIDAALKLAPGADFLKAARRDVDRQLERRAPAGSGALSADVTASGRAETPGTMAGPGAPPVVVGTASDTAGSGTPRPPGSDRAGNATSSSVPEPVRALNNEAHRLLAARDIPGATARLLEVIRQAPAWPVAWSNLGQAYYLAGRYDEARKAFETAIQLNPRYWKARLGLALTLANGFHDVPGARQALTVVVEQAPEAEAGQARQMLEGLVSIAGP